MWDFIIWIWGILVRRNIIEDLEVFEKGGLRGDMRWRLRFSDYGSEGVLG